MKRLCDDPLSADAARILRSAEMDSPSSPDALEARIVEAYAVARPAGSLGRWRWAFLASTLVIASTVVVAWPRRAAQAPAAKTELALPTIPIVAAAPEAVAPSVRVEDLPSAAAPEIVRVPAPLPVLDELAAIDAVRAALRAGHASEALARITACRKDFPHPRYSEEADALEIQALSSLGRLDDARGKAAAFFQAHPESPYEQRVRAEAEL